MKNKVICPDCNIEMVRRKSQFRDGFWWGCPNWPECTITAAEHPDGTLMSLPANKELKDLRIKAHKFARAIWGDYTNKECRVKMYSWLKKNTRTGHIGLMTTIDITLLIGQLKKMIRENKEEL